MSNDLHLPQTTTADHGDRSSSQERQTASSISAQWDAVNPLIEGVYVHVPFCAHRCHYCDFFTVADQDDKRDAFVDRLLTELESIPSWVGPEIQTIFVGGGTPTYLLPADLKRMVSALPSRFDVGHPIEFTIEANPETITEELAGILAEGGVNRVSLGAQSFDQTLLKTLERQHDPARVASSVEMLQAAGIRRTSLDLIFGIPGQDLSTWKEDLNQALEIGTGHLSCYGLIYEPGTPLRVRRDRGEVEPVEEEVEANMYEWTCERLEGHGLEQYEISNWARPGESCQHNLLYWQTRNWWPIGPSASGHVQGWRWRNLPRLASYLEGAGLPDIRDVEHLEEDGRIGEWFMMGLRLMEGLPRAEVDLRLACEGGQRRRPIIERHLEQGLLTWRGDHLALTPRGILLSNVVTADLLGPTREADS